MRNLVLLVGLLLWAGCQKPVLETPEKKYLHENWVFKKEQDTTWLPAIVPGNIHVDLYHNQQIPHPFQKDHENQLQWIAETPWVYSTAFKVPEAQLKKPVHQLHFKGLDTYAQVFFNGQLVVETNNAFRSWQVDVSTLIRADNELVIRFSPTSLHAEAEAKKLSYVLPEGPRIFTRKAQFQYGWDWGPTYNTMGIWKEVFLESHSGYKIEDVYIRQQQLSDEIAELTAEVTFLSVADEVELELWVNNQIVQSKTISRKGYSHKVVLPFEIQQPKRWWTHNLGEPYLYNITVRLKKDGLLLDSLTRKKGLRTVELVTEKDTHGESFYFKLNGEPVFMKGANYIPQNSFQNWVTEAHYEKLLQDVVAANMNMLRVWGGGIYENDVFYEKCDEKGILVWQDFMFACAMYPGDAAFLENIQQEAQEQVKRLRNYSSIALWCGNNESSEGWHRWGWQEGRSEDEKSEIWRDYLRVFDSILPQTVADFSEVPYWETSPKFGRGDVRYTSEGDAHDWWIWHDGQPFENLVNRVPRFMSEFGFQSFPHHKTLQLMSDSTVFSVQSAAVKAHQKHRLGMETILQYMERDFPVPTDDKGYVYVSQLLQAYGIGMGIEAHRRAKPYTMGSLYWQLNDCWPAISWSSIDYLGQWKALHYQAQKSFKNLLISSELVGDTLRVFVVNDDLKEHRGHFKGAVMDFVGTILQEYSKEIVVPPNSSQPYWEIPVAGYQEVADEIVFVATFNEEESLFYLVKPKELVLEEGDITTEITPIQDGFEIKMQSDVLQKNVFLYLENSEDTSYHFNKNFFDLLPHRPTTIRLQHSQREIPDIQIKTLNQLLAIPE